MGESRTDVSDVALVSGVGTVLRRPCATYMTTDRLSINKIIIDYLDRDLFAVWEIV